MLPEGSSFFFAIFCFSQETWGNFCVESKRINLDQSIIKIYLLIFGTLKFQKWFVAF